jgi:hypothetical protein
MINNLKIHLRQRVVFLSTIFSALVLTSCGVSSAITTTTTTTTTTVTPISCAEGGTCAVGDIGPGGGTVMYVASEPFTSEYSDCARECRAYGKAATKEFSACRDACYYLEVANVDVGTRMNWDEAIKEVSAWTSNGLSDWFLPTVEQFYQLSDVSKNCKFFESASGEYRPNYWTSSYDDDFGQPKFFSLGSCGTGRSWWMNTSRVRPIRAG